MYQNTFSDMFCLFYLNVLGELYQRDLKGLSFLVEEIVLQDRVL